MHREMLCISKPTATKWKKQYQHACHEEVATIDEKIGGPENVVEADATYLCTKRKCVGGVPRGREKGAKKCLYVAVERKSRRIAVELAGRPDENQETAEAFAVAHIAQNSHIESDAGAAFANLGHLLNSTHATVPHCRTFATSEGVHSNTVEGRNMLIKRWLKWRCGTSYKASDDVLLYNLAQYTWEQWSTDSSGTLQYAMFIFSLSKQFGFWLQEQEQEQEQGD